MMITGQGNGQGGREHGQKADQLAGHAVDHRSRASQVRRGRLGHRARERCPGPGLSAPEIMEAIHRGEIKALFSMCFNPLVSLPDANFTREALSKLEFFGVIDFFLSETAHHADLVFCGSMHEEDEGVVCSAEGRVQKINKAVDPPGDAKSDALIICDLAKRLGKGQYFDYPVDARDLRGAARSRRRAASPTTTASPGSGSRTSSACSGRARRSAIPGTPRLFEDGRFYHADGKAHLQVTEWRESGDPLRRDVPAVPDDRTRRQSLPLGHADAPHRAARRAVPRAEDRAAPAPRRAARHRRPATGSAITTRRADVVVAGERRQHDPSRHGLHPVSLAGPALGEPADASHARSAQQDPRVQGVGLPDREDVARRPISRRMRLEETGWLPAVEAADAGRAPDERLRVLRRSVALHRLPRLRGGVRRVRHASRRLDDPRGLHRPPELDRDDADGVHALRRADVRAGVPGRRDQEGGGRHRPQRVEAALHRLLELRAGVSVRHPDRPRRARADDEVRHVLRPHVGRAAADVRDGLPEPGADVRPAATSSRGSAPRRRPATSGSATSTSGRRCS